MKRTVLALLLVFVLLVGWRLHDKLSRVPPPSLDALHARDGIPVTVVAPERADLSERIEFHGGLVAGRDVKIYAEIAGVMVERRFDAGDRVDPGALLARIDDREFRAQFLMAEADLAIARSTLEKARTGARPQEVAAAEAAVAGARANAERARDERERVAGMERSRSVSESRVTAARKAEEAARAALAAAEAQLSAVREGTRREDLAMAEAAFQAATGRFALAKLTFEKTEIRAPFTGIVAERAADRGDFLLPATNPTGKAICRLLDLDPLHFIGRINERFVVRLAPGAAVAVEVGAAGLRLTGEVLLIDPAGDPGNRDYRVKIALPNPDGRMLPGMFATASLTLAECRDALALPAGIVRDRRGDAGSLFVVAGETARRVAVELGVREGERVEVRGLAPDARVVATGAEGLVDGARVRVVAE